MTIVQTGEAVAAFLVACAVVALLASIVAAQRRRFSADSVRAAIARDNSRRINDPGRLMKTWEDRKVPR